MTEAQRIIVTGRTAGPIEGYTTVRAEVDGGASGDYLIADGLIATQGELDAIRQMSERRKGAIDATRSGIS